MGQVYEEELQDPDRAIEAYNDILSFDADHADALARAGAPLRADRAVGARRRGDAAAGRLSDDQARRST